MTNKEVIAWIRSRCHEDGDCLIWDGAVAKGGAPAARNPNTDKTAPARRILMEALGYDIQGKMATTTCGNPLCMEEAHLAAWTRKKLQQRSAEKLPGNLVRSAKLAEVSRRQSTLTMDVVREIRASGLPAKAAADQFGITLNNASRIIRGVAWKEYGRGNPFQGLGSRHA